MTIEVSSTFYDIITQTNPESLAREFTIGGSDYTDRVTKWPSASFKWDDVKPITYSIDLANEDGALNIIQIDKTLFTSRCVARYVDEPKVIAVGPTFDNSEFSAGTLDTSSQGLPSVTGFTFCPGGTYALVSNTDGTIRKYICESAGNFTTSSDTGEQLHINSLWGSYPGGNYGLAMGGNPRKLITNCGCSVFGIDLLDDLSIESATITSTLGLPDTIKFRSIAVDSSGEHLFMASVESDCVIKFQLGSDTTLTNVTTHSTLITSGFGSSLFVLGVGVNPDGSRIFTSVGCSMVMAYDVSSDISSCSPIADDIIYVNSVDGQAVNPYDIDFGCNSDGYPIGMSFINISSYCIETLLADTQIDSASEARYVVAAGAMESIAYNKGKATIRFADKLSDLSRRIIGTDDSPVEYSSALASDIAWWLCTSWGGLDLTKSASNTDIDYDSFIEWAAVMSGDNIRMSSRFRGEKVTEALRKLAAGTRTAIYIEQDKLFFNRFSSVNSVIYSISNSQMVDTSIEINGDDVVNKQWVHAAYSVASDYFTIVVNDVLSSSIGSFGLYEDIYEDTSLWFVDSTSALSLAQRMIFTEGEPNDRISASVPLCALLCTIGDTIGYINNQIGINENYRIMNRKFDMNKSKIQFGIDRTQLVNPFILDVTSLDGTEVLT